MSTLKTYSFDSAGISGNPAVIRLPSMSSVCLVCMSECLTVCFSTATEINRMFALYLSESLIYVSVAISFSILPLPLWIIIENSFSYGCCMTLEISVHSLAGSQHWSRLKYKYKAVIVISCNLFIT